MKNFKLYVKAILFAFLSYQPTSAMDKPEDYDAQSRFRHAMDLRDTQIPTNVEIAKTHFKTLYDQTKYIPAEIAYLDICINDLNSKYELLEKREQSLVDSLKEGDALTENQKELNQIQSEKHALSTTIIDLFEAKHYAELYVKNEGEYDTSGSKNLFDDYAFTEEDSSDIVVFTKEQKIQQKRAEQLKRRHQLHDAACSYLTKRLRANQSILKLLTSKSLKEQAGSFYKPFISPLISQLDANNQCLTGIQAILNDPQKELLDKIVYFYKEKKFKEDHYIGCIQDDYNIIPLLLDTIKKHINYTIFSTNQGTQFMTEAIKLFRKIYYYDNFDAFEDSGCSYFLFDISCHLMNQHDLALQQKGYESGERLEILMGTVHFANAFLNQFSYFDEDDPYSDQLMTSKRILNIMHGTYITRTLNRQYPIFREIVFLPNNHLTPTIHEFYDFAHKMQKRLSFLNLRQIEVFLRNTEIMQHPLIQEEQHIYVHKTKPFNIRVKTNKQKLTIGLIQKPYDMGIQSHLLCLTGGHQDRHYILNSDMIEAFNFYPSICDKSFEILKFRVYKFFHVPHPQVENARTVLPRTLTAHGAVIPANIEHEKGVLNSVNKREAKEALKYAHFDYGQKR